MIIIKIISILCLMVCAIYKLCQMVTTKTDDLCWTDEIVWFMEMIVSIAASIIIFKIGG